MAPKSKTLRSGKASLTILPNEVLDHISSFLDLTSLASLACTQTRLLDVCTTVPIERIRQTSIHVSMLQYLSFVGSGVRYLDLSDCLSDSHIIKKLIQQCPGVIELKVVNSTLTSNHLLDAIRSLNTLETLDASVLIPSGKEIFSSYPSVRKIYIEFPPDHDAMNFVVVLLDSCQGLRQLHVKVIGEARKEITRETLDVSPEVLARLEKMVYETDPRSSRSGHCLCCHVLNRDQTLPHRELLNNFSEELWWFERPPRSDAQAQDRPSFNTMVLFPSIVMESFQPNWAKIGLTVQSPSCTDRLVPNMSTLASLVELDFTGCHFTYTSAAWWSLTHSSPAVTALAVPSCALFIHEADQPPTVMNDSTMRALRRLNVRTLHVETPVGGCQRCGGKLTGILTRYLSDFPCLQELTLKNVLLEDGFFSFLEQSVNLKTFKLKVRHWNNFRGLRSFFEKCGRLLEFALEAPNLGSGCGELLAALPARNLRRLCIATNTKSALRLEDLAARLPQLLSNIEILHLHAARAKNVKAVASLVQKEVSKANRTRITNPVRLVNARISTGDMRLPFATALPERTLCSFDSTCAKPRI